eukprot:5334701-Pyramimonas_sp.AAC.1
MSIGSPPPASGFTPAQDFTRGHVGTVACDRSAFGSAQWRSEAVFCPRVSDCLSPPRVGHTA